MKNDLLSLDKHTLSESKNIAHAEEKKRKNQSDGDREKHPRVNKLSIVQCLLQADREQAKK